MTTITKQDLIDIAYCPSNTDLEKELARMLLASMQQEPVAHLNATDVNNVEEHILARRLPSKACTMPVYAAPQPATVVPSFNEWLISTKRKPVAWVREVMEESYNACRAAMLNGGK